MTRRTWPFCRSTRVGRVTHPSAAPGNDLLVVWTPGPANDLNRPTPLPYYDGGLYQAKQAGRDRVVFRCGPATRPAEPAGTVSD